MAYTAIMNLKPYIVIAYFGSVNVEWSEFIAKIFQTPCDFLILILLTLRDGIELWRCHFFLLGKSSHLDCDKSLPLRQIESIGHRSFLRVSFDLLE